MGASLFCPIQASVGHVDPHGGRGRLHLLLTQVLLPSQDTLADTPRNALYLLPEHRGSMEVTPGTGLKPHPAFSGLGLVQRPAIFFFFRCKNSEELYFKLEQGLSSHNGEGAPSESVDLFLYCIAGEAGREA